MELKGSKTEANLMEAFAGEAQAHTKYQYYASKARKEGMNQIADIFEETARNEREHAKLWFKFLHGGEVPTTEINLQAAADGENYEWNEMYKGFAEVAKQEGFTRIAKLFEMVGVIESEHETRYLKFLENLKTGRIFAKEDAVLWKCGNCGHIHYGSTAPEVCPVCEHPKAFFEVKAENY